jgi:phosphatidate cytidylyltransferase
MVSLLLTAAYFDLQWGAPESWGMPGVMAFVLLCLCGVLATWEFAALTLPAVGGTWGSQAVMVLASLMVTASCCLNTFLPAEWRATSGGGLWLLCGLILGSALTIGGEMRAYGQPAMSPLAHQTTGRIAMTLLAMLYIGLPLGVLGLLRQTGPNPFGLWALLSVLVIPKVSDSGAYFVGRTWGKRKLIPRLSPGKTVAGAFGGLAFGVLAACLMCFLIAPGLFQIQPPLPLMGACAYGLLVSAAAMAGDLAESMFKRDAGIKDSGGWLPGLGGMLDVVDSVLAASFAAYLFWHLIPGVPLS